MGPGEGAGKLQGQRGGAREEVEEQEEAEEGSDDPVSNLNLKSNLESEAAVEFEPGFFLSKNGRHKVGVGGREVGRKVLGMRGQGRQADTGEGRGTEGWEEGKA